MFWYKHRLYILQCFLPVTQTLHVCIVTELQVWQHTSKIWWQCCQVGSAFAIIVLKTTKFYIYFTKVYYACRCKQLTWDLPKWDMYWNWVSRSVRCLGMIPADQSLGLLYIWILAIHPQLPGWSLQPGYNSTGHPSQEAPGMPMHSST